jgi:hypothetical protein
MRVLVGFECTGTVRDAFLARGHDALSCDLLPSDRPGPHHRGDIFEVIRREWDLAILHPPCTALSVSGNGTYAEGKPGWPQRLEAVAFVDSLVDACAHIPSVCLENPVGVLSTMSKLGYYARRFGTWRCQYIQPHWFGHPESKKTGLWLRGLDELAPTQRLALPACGYWENQTPSGQNKLGPSADRWKKRAATYAGVADAMAAQWGRG